MDLYTTVFILTTLAVAQAGPLRSHGLQLEVLVGTVGNTAKSLFDRHCSDIGQSACNLIINDADRMNSCHLPALQTVSHHMNKHEQLRRLYEKVSAYERQLKSGSLCYSPVFQTCCHLLADPERCESTCRPEARVCKRRGDELLIHTEPLLNFIRQHVTGTSDSQVSFPTNSRSSDVRACLLAYLHRVNKQVDIFMDAL